MCIIAIKPEGISIPIERLKTCWEHNPDGAGFMYSENNKLKIVKGLMTFDSFIKAYDEVNPLTKRIVIHFRYGTHGDICPDLTHPFNVNEDLALVHNGILSINLDDPFEIQNKVNPKDFSNYIGSLLENGSDLDVVNHSDNALPNGELEEFTEMVDEINEIEVNTSDSLEFCKMLRKLPKRFLSNNAIFFLLNKYIQNEGSVIVFMDNIGNINIVGSNSHIVEDGVWYSNHDYFESEIKKEQNAIKADREKCPYCSTGSYSCWMLDNGHPAMSLCNNVECPTNLVLRNLMKGTENALSKE